MDMLQTSTSSLSDTVYTTTSSSTQWGPGAMAGKAILAMGKAVVRSAEYLVISRRLSNIKAALPCSDNDLSQQRNLEAIFEDLLDLSRPTLYPEAFRMQAIQLILAQIASKEIYHLLCGISKWEIDHDELVSFLSEIIGVVLFSKRGFVDEKLVSAYMAALPQDSHPWSPCISFLTKIAELNHHMFSGVLGARFLEMILWVSGSQKQGKRFDKVTDGACSEEHTVLEDACLEAFAILSDPPSQYLSLLWVEQVAGLCSSHLTRSLLGMVNSLTFQHRWRVVEARLLAMHADAMLNMMLQHGQLFQLGNRYIPFGSQYIGAGDLSDYLPHSAFLHSKSILSAQFLRNFLLCAGIGGDVVHSKTIEYLTRLSYKKQVVALTQMIQHLVLQSHVDPSTVESAMVLFTPETPDIARNIVQFLKDISGSLQSAESPLLDATLLNILPFVQIRWDPGRVFGDIYRRVYSPLHRRHKSLPSYRAHTLELVSRIRSFGLCTVVNEVDRMGDWVYFLQPLF
ncbi:hypothetical protein DFH08DRAFT_841843 [Mycena albidolilacea]|uniref:Uncharacterized protein n=1 Tax=Mycena albidolilacea TaxID=1033008 RepID=A0AAD7F0W7_9AGAR|nr:hypothetical protein DFH08DRAFT_841843 [Mycena albidolilacea]